MKSPTAGAFPAAAAAYVSYLCSGPPSDDDAALGSVSALDPGVPAVEQQHSAPPVLPPLPGGGAEGVVGASGV